jgi:hypothetical protein
MTYTQLSPEDQRQIDEARYREFVARERYLVLPGKQVRVVKGRKVPVGVGGRCFWVGDGRFGRRCGIKTSDGTTYFTAVGNVEVVLFADERAAIA